MIIETRSDSRDQYDMRSNRISAAEDYNTRGFREELVFDEVKLVSALPNIDTFIIEFTQQCNMRCSYCCYGGAYKGNRTHSSKTMSINVLNSTIDFIIANRVADRKLTVVLYGGEPLTRFPDVKEYVGRLRAEFEDADIVISTNGLLLSEAVQWLIANDIYLNVSIDGMESLHDVSRRDIAGNPTFIESIQISSESEV